jgi:predicted negative regulator of RcsB-dependent stress response
VADHLSEEEQIERLKRWWAEQGRGVVAAVVLLAVSYGGWNYYQHTVEQANLAASSEYQALSDLLVATPLGEPLDSTLAIQLESRAAALKESAANSQYGRYAALLLARLAVERDDLAGAAEQLRWVLASDPDGGLSAVTTLRLARVLAANGDVDAALALVQSPPELSFSAAYAELRGDLHRSQGNDGAAFTAYQAALEAGVEQSAEPLLELKLNAVAASAVIDSGDGAADQGEQ